MQQVDSYPALQAENTTARQFYTSHALINITIDKKDQLFLFCFMMCKEETLAFCYYPAFIKKQYNNISSSNIQKAVNVNLFFFASKRSERLELDVRNKSSSSF